MSAVPRPELAEDGRRWWVVGAAAWEGTALYAAKTGRSALAAYRRDLIEQDVANGLSRRDAAESIRCSGLRVVEGPLPTPVAFEREFGWALAFAVTRRMEGGAGRQSPVSPASIEDCVGWLTEHEINVIRQNVLAGMETE